LFGSGGQSVESSDDRQETIMHIETYANDGAVVLAPYGRLTGDADTLIREVSRAARDGCRKVVVDLSAVSMIDAGGLGVLVTIHRIGVANLIALSLARVPRRIRQVLTITHLTRLLPIFDSVEEARPHGSIRPVRALPRHDSARA
jgi:anti-anti-sigma factor